MDEYRIFPILIVFMLCTLTTLAYVLQHLGKIEARAEPGTCSYCGQPHGLNDTDCPHCGTTITNHVRDRVPGLAPRGTTPMIEDSMFTPVQMDEEAHAPSTIAGLLNSTRH